MWNQEKHTACQKQMQGKVNLSRFDLDKSLSIRSEPDTTWRPSLQVPKGKLTYQGLTLIMGGVTNLDNLEAEPPSPHYRPGKWVPTTPTSERNLCDERNCTVARSKVPDLPVR